MQAATSGIGWKDKIAYALGDTGGQLTASVLSTFLMVFYSDVLGLDMGHIRTMMIIVRLWDAINDPLWGMIVDTRKVSKHGRYRQYLLWLSSPRSLVCIFAFIKIPGLTQTQYLVFAYIAYILFDFVDTAISIPYGSLASVITDDERERAALSTFRSIGSGLGGLPAQILLPIFIYTAAVPGGKEILNGSRLLLATVILAILSVLLYYVCFRNTKERILPPAVQKQEFHLFETVHTLLCNRPFLVISLVAMLSICVTIFTGSVNQYLFKDYFEKPKLFSAATIATYAPMVLCIPFIDKLVARFGKKELCAVGMLLSAVASAVLAFSRTTNPYIFLVFSFIAGIGITFLTLQVWALATDAIDYQQLLSGKQEEGMSYSVFSFTRKLGHTAATGGAAWLLSAIGYISSTDGVEITQTKAVCEGMYTIATAIPAAAYLLIFLLLAFLYPLGKKQIPLMREQLAQRRMEATSSR